ncbi:ChaN family lipoprotein [Oceanicella actignis]|uniref:ChaN family lipoprotein n=1 Tax=Oceanicella actignis TaxID=1189325 RepID=UPI0011E7CBE2|nr:ChaN family lipoprotein [Oceanicella actignis]TYO90190.1 putative iron-regulated protein [Oceanicella actignis]
MKPIEQTPASAARAAHRPGRRAVLAGALALCACARAPRPSLGASAAAGAADDALRIEDLRARRRLPGLAALADLARGAPLIVVGEIHDNPAHQRNAARLARLLNVGAVALEMLPEGDEPRAEALRAAGAPRAGQEAPEWARYLPILGAVPDAAAIGAGVPRERLRMAARQGAAAAFGPDAARFGLDAPLPEELAAPLRDELRASHCGLAPERMIPAMLEAQRLRDAAFARALLRARQAAGGRAAMLVTGDGHARRDRGVPRALALAAPGLRVFVIGQFEAAPGFGPPAGVGALFDAMILSAPAPRADPCAQLRARGPMRG